MEKWTREETFNLISGYEAIPELWDEKNPLYKDCRKRNQRFQELAELCNRNVEVVKKKIHSLRSVFSRELKKGAKKKSGQGTDDIYKSSWDYFSAMQFIKSSVTGDPTISNLDESSTDISEPPSTNDANNDTESESFNPKIPDTRRKKKSSKNTEEDLAYAIALEQLKKPDDSLQIYGDYVASELREMAEINRKKAKMEITKILLRYAENELVPSTFLKDQTTTELGPSTSSGKKHIMPLQPAQEYYEGSQEWLLSNNQDGSNNSFLQEL